MAIKAVLATKKLGEHLRRDAQHMRVTGALERDGPAEQPKGRWLELWSSMRCWRGGSSTWSFVSRHQDTSTVPHQGFILEPARAFTRERQKLGAGGVAALVERTLEGETDAQRICRFIHFALIRHSERQLIRRLAATAERRVRQEGSWWKKRF